MSDVPEMVRNHDSPDESVKGNSAPVQIMRVLLSERGAMIFAVVLAGMLAAWAAARVAGLKDHIDANQQIMQNEITHYRDDFLKLDRQARMTELKLDDWTVVAHRAGLRLPGDYTRGPQGNLDAESFNIPQSKPKGK